MANTIRVLGFIQVPLFHSAEAEYNKGSHPRTVISFAINGKYNKGTWVYPSTVISNTKVKS
jgi:hypothetical protein